MFFLKEQRVFGKGKKNQGDKVYFNLFVEGQTPDILYIGCSDSRVTTGELMEVGPGDVFLHRNIGNIVSNVDLNSISVIKYPARHVKVGHVVVCSHYYCVGVKSAMDSSDLGTLKPSCIGIKAGFRLSKLELDVLTDEEGSGYAQ